MRYLSKNLMGIERSVNRSLETFDGSPEQYRVLLEIKEIIWRYKNEK